ncbi:MAG TPA: TatD family hydrolase [Bacteroidota bacterium]|nr:TatD family hydrolase [Bacteroidota bacterium]
MFIDSHCHLTAKEFDADREEVLQRALDAGVHAMVCPGTTIEDSRRAVELASKYDSVYACVGVHPHEAAKAGDRMLEELRELSAQPKVVAIGEIGLDFHYDFSPRDVQERVFREQLDLARERNLPVVIHTRESMDRTLAIVEQVLENDGSWRDDQTFVSRYPHPKGVFHCYPGDLTTAWRLLGLGFSLSFPGIVTFKNSGSAKEVAGAIPIEHILLETDSPYLAPVPLRGKRNEPANIPLVAAAIASLQGLSSSDVARATNYAALKLFGIGTVGAPQFTYTLRDALYVNLTIRCNADCIFCDRGGDAIIKGINLKIEKEPTAEEVMAEIGDPTRYKEIVFCGYGEPTIRLEDMKTVARWVKQRGGRTRLNTNGHGNVINKRNILPELVGLIDAMSISLNATDPEEYGRLMRLNGPTFFNAMLDFAREAVKLFPRVVLTIVDIPEIEKPQAMAIAREVGAEFSVRPYF